jgi:glucokinase
MILGFDIGGTKSAVALADGSGVLIARSQVPTRQDLTPESMMDRLIERARRLLAREGIPQDALIGIGLSCGGPLDPEEGIVYTPSNLPHWNAVPVKAIVEDTFRRPVRVENDANATAWAEYLLGAGQGCRHLAYLTMGTGIGAGLVLDGRLYRGRHFLAGEIGHVVLQPDGPICGCGKRGCLEALASGPAVARRAQERLPVYPESLLHRLVVHPGQLTAREVVRAAKRKDPLALQILQETGMYWGQAISYLLQILDLERVLLGTLAIHAGDLILEPARRTVRRYTWHEICHDVLILPAGLGVRAQDYAAIALWLNENRRH